MTNSLTERCKALVESVKLLSDMENEEIFKMIYKYNSTYTRNNNGIFVNLSWLSEDLLEKLELYVKFCNRSQNEIKKYESLCDVLNLKLHETSMLHKDEIKKEKEKEKEKDKIDNDKRLADEMEELEDLQDNEINCNSKISSSMRFSLLKKRFSKQYTFNYQSYQNNLQTECYIKN
jgi:hypothetical protein